MTSQEQRTPEDQLDAFRYRALKRNADTIFLLREVRLMKNGKPVFVKMIEPNELDEAIDSVERP